MGSGSPGVVLDNEVVFRLIVSPAEVDWEKKIIVGEVTLGQLAEDGMSVFRSTATDEEIANLVVDRLSRRPDQRIRTVQALARLEVLPVRSLVNIGPVGRAFCIYDETIPRKIDHALPHVPTHATILQRLLPAGEAGRKTHMRTGRDKIRGLLEIGLENVDEYRNGLIAALNARSEAGEFVLQSAEEAA